MVHGCINLPDNDHDQHVMTVIIDITVYCVQGYSTHIVIISPSKYGRLIIIEARIPKGCWVTRY